MRLPNSEHEKHAWRRAPPTRHPRRRRIYPERATPSGSAGHRNGGPDRSPYGFQPLYRTDVESAAEISNRTVHAVMHLAWVDQGTGRYQGQMGVYVKPRGRFGAGYMALIAPFRHWVVYPALMRQIERAWDARTGMPLANDVNA